MKANKDITVEIIYSKEFNRANLKFSGIPSEECRTEMKKEGWIYSKNHNVWYPKNDAAANSLDFANALKQKYYPDIQVNPEEIITEETEVNEILTMIQDKMGVDAIVAKLSEMYGPEALVAAVNAIENEKEEIFPEQKEENKTKEKSIAEIADIMIQQAYELSASGFNYYMDYEEVARLSGKSVEWVEQHIEEIDQALMDHNDNELLDYNPEEGHEEPRNFNFNFCSIGEDANELFKFENNRWIRKTDEELIREGLMEEEPIEINPKKRLDKIIEMFENGPSGSEFKAYTNEKGLLTVEILSNGDSVYKREQTGNIIIQRNTFEAAYENEMKSYYGAAEEYFEILDAMQPEEWREYVNKTVKPELNLDGQKSVEEDNPIIKKFDDIIQKNLIELTEEDKKYNITQEQKKESYEMWSKPVVDEIRAALTNRNPELEEKVNEYVNTIETAKNPLSGPGESFKSNFLYPCYEIVQEKIKEQFNKTNTPYVLLNWSESPVFPAQNKIYTIREFNELITKADKELHNRKEYALTKYGSYDNYEAAQEEGKIPEEDKGIRFGYDKTNFQIFNIPNLEKPGDTYSYNPLRYDIGDGNGSIFDDIRAMCSYDEIIRSMNLLEQQLYQPKITEKNKKQIDKIVDEENIKLIENLKEPTSNLEVAIEAYKELHKNWLIEEYKEKEVNNTISEALNRIKETYDASMVNVFKKFISENPLSEPFTIKENQTLQYLSSKTKQMFQLNLYLPSREAQKAMNNDDTKGVYKTDWETQRRIWEMFPHTCNHNEYINTILESVMRSLEVTYESSVTQTEAEKLTKKEIEEGKKVAQEAKSEQYEREYKAEEGENYDSSLSTTDIAKKLRGYIKENYPGYKFSVTSKYFSGGSEINVSLKKAPVEITNYETMKTYYDNSHSSLQVWDNTKSKYVNYFEMSEEEKRSYIEDRIKGAHYQNISRHNTEESLSWMTPEVKKVMSDVVRTLESYNFDHSDSQTDYFHVNFWSDYRISQEAIEYSLELSKEKENKVTTVTNSYTDEIIEKIKAAGIEVITDKSSFERILETESVIQKMAVSLSELEELSNSIENQKNNIHDEETKSEGLSKEEKILNEFSLENFAKAISEYKNIFPENEYIKIENLDYIKPPYKDFELWVGKNRNGELVLSFTDINVHDGYRSGYNDFYDFEKKSFLKRNANTQFHYEEMVDVFEISKGLFSKKDYIPIIQDELKNILESIKSRNADILENLIKENESRKDFLGNKISEIKELEKIEARKNVDNWLYEAEEKAEDLWNKDQVDVKEYFKNNDDRKSVGIIPEKALQIFEGIDDYHLYADKSVLIHHYLNRHYDNRLYENIQNVLDKYTNIYYDNKQNSVCFAKKYGTLADCLFVKQEQGKVILFASTYNQPEHRLHSERYKKITPANTQELESLEGSTPLSQNPEGNTAAAISDVNDNSIISDTTDLSRTQKMTVSDGTTYGFVHNGKIYLNPEIMNSNAAVHEYTHLWDAYTQKTNPELWEKGLGIFKNTKYWDEVTSDLNYQNIKNDENLVLSEIHSRICGDMAEKVLNRIAELDGDKTKLDAIDWDKETWNYVFNELELNIEHGYDENGRHSHNDIVEFLSTPMKDLMSGKAISLENKKPYNFFINDVANLDLGIGAEIEPITGLSAEQAAIKYAELKDKGLSPYIGLHIPGDFIFDNSYYHQDLYEHPLDGVTEGCAIFTETVGKPSFYIGEDFVKRLREYDEHAKNVIDAYKELYTQVDKYILGVKKPEYVFTKEAELTNKSEEPKNKNVLTAEDLELCRKVVPPSQLAFTLELTKGEEGKFFNDKLKEIADTYRRINVNHELVNDDGTHNVGFRYFLGNTEIFISEIDSDGIGFGYNILNGDLQMSEWGSTSLEEILSIPYMEMDYHVPEGITIEKMLYQEHPEYFTEYAPTEEKIEQKFNNDLFEQEYVKDKPATFRYELLARMQSDCDYYIGKGNRSAEKLWSRDEVSHLKNMISLFNSFSFEDKPEWLTIEQLSKYTKELTGKTLEDNGWKQIIDENNIFQELPWWDDNISPEMEKRIDSGEIFGTNTPAESNSVLNSYTNEIIEKIKAAGINVEISADKIQEIIQLRKDINKMTARSGLYWNGKPYEYTMAEYALNSNLDIKWLNHFFGTTTSVIYQFNPINGGFQPQVAQERLQALLKTAERMSYTGDTVSSRSKLGKERLRTFEFFAEQIRNGNIGYFDRGAPISTDAPNWITVNETKIIDEPEYMFENGLVVGLAYENNIVLNPEYLSSNAAIHEYTHLWDAYTQKTNPELWGKGLEIFKDTKYWNEVISDPNYKDIKDDENLVLSEIHSRICGDIAEKVLERIAELDGEQVKLDAIDWDKETWAYIATNIGFHTFDNVDPELKIKTSELRDFLSTPMKDLMAGKNISPEASWEEIAHIFRYHESDGINKSFEETKAEIWDDNKPKSEHEWKTDTLSRYLDDNLLFLAYENADENNSHWPQILEERWNLIDQITDDIISKRVNYTNQLEIQSWLIEQLHNSELYKTVENEFKRKSNYNFFVNDTANLDLGIGAEFEPITGLSAEQAVSKYAELKDTGLSPYIGLNIPGDIVFDDEEGQGAGIFCENEGKSSFYIGDHFVKGLKHNDEHAKNVIAAYKDLYEMAEKFITNVEKPIFVFNKESELNNPKIPLQVYSFSPFGYEGTIVTIETELRRGIPATDIVGIADSLVKETRERIQKAFLNSNLDYPSERVLQSLSPADIRKETPMDLAMALSILGQTNNYPIKEPVLAIGELELDGKIRPVRGAVAAVNTAKAQGITNIVCDPGTAEILQGIEGIRILSAENLKDVNEKLLNAEAFQETEPKLSNSEKIEFNEEEWISEALSNLSMEGKFDSVRALEIAVAGKHNIIATGTPDSGKEQLAHTLIAALTPKLTAEESESVTRINSLAGLDSAKHDKLVSPIRMPHFTASLEGMIGGGINCRPGEISLAHNGTLFMDDAVEFRTAVIQSVRVPLENRKVTLSRAGRHTVYPADFQLALTMNPCPCGNYGSNERICLDSDRVIEAYWKKVSSPLMDRVEIKAFVEKDENDKRKVTLEQMKSAITNAYEIQRKRGVFNSHLNKEQISQYCKLNEQTRAWFEEQNTKQGEISSFTIDNILKTSLTIANMEGRENIHLKDLQEAYGYCMPGNDILPISRKKYYEMNQKQINTSHIRATEINLPGYSLPFEDIPEEMREVQIEYEVNSPKNKQEKRSSFSAENDDMYKEDSEKQFLQKQKETMSHSKGWDNDFPTVYSSMLYKDVKRNPELEELRIAAKAGDKDKAFEFVQNVVNFEMIESLKSKYPDAIICHVHAEEASGLNKIPVAYKSLLADYGFETTDSIVQTVTAHHTGANNIKRLVNRVRFEGDVKKGRDYILVDDHADFGGTLRDLKDYIETNGGNVVAFSTLTTLEQNTRISPTRENLEKLNKYGGKVDELLEQYGITDNKEGLTNGEINGLLQVLADTSKDRSFEAGFHRSFSVLCREIQQDFRKKARLQEKLIPVVNRFNNLTKNLPEDIISESQKKSVISLINENNETVVKMINSYNKESSTPGTFAKEILKNLSEGKTPKRTIDYSADYTGKYPAPYAAKSVFNQEFIAKNHFMPPVIKNDNGTYSVFAEKKDLINTVQLRLNDEVETVKLTFTEKDLQNIIQQHIDNEIRNGTKEIHISKPGYISNEQNQVFDMLNVNKEERTALMKDYHKNLFSFIGRETAQQKSAEQDQELPAAAMEDEGIEY